VNPRVKACAHDDIRAWRELYREEMGRQIVHDSLHSRPGWAEQFLLCTEVRNVGYGSVLIGGPWVGSRTVFEFYVLPSDRCHVFALFSALLKAAGATAVQAQTSDSLLAAMLHWACRDTVAKRSFSEMRLSRTCALLARW
jgi:hypothetical protein